MRSMKHLLKAQIYSEVPQWTEQTFMIYGNGAVSSFLSPSGITGIPAGRRMAYQTNVPADFSLMRPRNQLAKISLK